MEPQKSPNDQSNLKQDFIKKKKKKLSDFKLYYEAIVTKTVWCCHTDRRIEQ